MRKLILKSVFDKGEVLTRAQLRKVMGGKGSFSSCSATCTCPGGQTITYSIDDCDGVCDAADNGGVHCRGLDGSLGGDFECSAFCLGPF
jgi:hypothetical protein